MQIKNVVFNKGDFLYSIEYFDGKAVRKVSTNEEALNSFDLSVSALAKALKDFLLINESYVIKIQKIKFGKNDDCASAVTLNVYTGGKDMVIQTKIIPVNENEHFTDQLLLSCNEHLKDVRGEVEKYINGEVAQNELPFNQEEAEPFDVELSEEELIEGLR